MAGTLPEKTGTTLSAGATVLPKPDAKHGYVRAMFDAIAPRYDLLNSVLSARLHHSWRRAAAAQTGLKSGDSALDICTGTADLAFELARLVGLSGQVIGSDFSAPMLELGEQKRQVRRTEQLRLMLADAQNLPFETNTFDAVTVAFGIRNVADRQQGFNEMARVTRPGGRVVVLEFNQPRNPLFAALYRWYSFHIMPRIGGLISGRKEAYEYLPSSVAAFPSRNEIAEEMRRAGLTRVRYADLTLGIVVIHSGEKPV